MMKTNNPEYTFNKFKELYKCNKLPNCIMIETNNLDEIFELTKKLISNLLNTKKNYESKLTFINNSYDLFVLDENINISIDDIRRLKKFSNYMSLNKDKFVIINNADLLNDYSSNALLKTLEESVNCYFFLIADINNSVLDTIKSRCCVFKFCNYIKIEKEFEDIEILIEKFNKSKNLKNFNNIKYFLIKHFSNYSSNNYLKLRTIFKILDKAKKYNQNLKNIIVNR
ncbi:MAG: hypothetical protein CMI81_00045 [Candidatus Pelagibacter sp.]|nr:hypothetical protein [Candidatus Pelagibacter sp.]OUV98797.1 MAG: hypothetical protein CBD02_00485 [Candidatus Pelagibacter sp. TMED142]